MNKETNNFQKRVLIISYEFPPIVGGAGIYALDLAKGLARIGCKVDVLTYGYKKKLKEFFGNTFRLYLVPFSWYVGAFSLFLAAKLLGIPQKYELFILNDSGSKTLSCLIYLLFKKELSRSISIFHGGEIEAYFTDPSFPKKIFRIGSKLGKLFREQKKLVAVSVSEYNKICAHFKGYDEKIVLNYHGVDPECFFILPDSLINKIKYNHGLPSNSKIILTVSRLVKNKGQDTVIDAYNLLRKKIPNSFLLIIGEGDYKAELVQKVQKYKIERNVLFLGTKDRKDLVQYYNICDIFVLLSRFEEAFGLVYLEANACGKMVLAGDRGGISDAVEVGVSGYVLPSEDPERLANELDEILSNENKRINLNNSAYNRYIKGFTNVISASNLLRKL